MKKVSEVQSHASGLLCGAGVPNARREAGSLLSLALNRDRTFIIANPDHILSDEEIDAYLAIVKRRSNREPFQHISGLQEFWGIDFIVSPDVLIPRSETELIVEAAIELIGNKPEMRFCEVGVGSGCIAISILSDVKRAKAVGLDISKKALAIAKRNSERVGVSERIVLEFSDVFGALGNQKFDLIISNPPYVSVDEMSGLQAEVRDFDPVEALTDGKDGLSIIAKIIDKSPNHLEPGGYLLMEIGFGQSKNVRQRFDMNLWKQVEIVPDLQGIPRMVKARLTNS